MARTVKLKPRLRIEPCSHGFRSGLSPRIIFFLRLSADRSVFKTFRTTGPSSVTADRSVRRYSIAKAGIFTSAFLFFLLLFFCFRKMTRSTRFSLAPDVFTIYLIVYLFIYFYSLALPPAVVVVRVVVVTSAPASSWRLFASAATVCLEAGTSAVKHHHFSWSITPPYSLISKVIETKFSKLIRSWRRQLEIMSPFFVTMVYT